MTIKVCGLHNSRYVDIGKLVPHLDLAIECDAKKVTTLKEVIAFYQEQFPVEVYVMDSPLHGLPENVGKYFWYKDLTKDSKQAVDIHIFRDDIEICPKQDLNFALCDGDIVEMGALIC